jgi:hypothetical protein
MSLGKEHTIFRSGEEFSIALLRINQAILKNAPVKYGINSKPS